MDDHRFDDLVRSLGSTSRRRMTRLLVAGLVGAIGRPAREADAACGRLGRRCGGGKRCCAGTACRGGRCRCKTGVACAGRCCPAGQRCADARCVAPCVPEDPATTCGQDGCGPQRNNCGREVDYGPCVCHPYTTCGRFGCGVKRDACGDEVQCGDCDPLGTHRVCDASGTCDCLAPRQECNYFCVDTATDVDHCGRCGRYCGGTATCRGGSCFSDHCPDVPACGASASVPCDARGDCLCMRGVDGGIFCGQAAMPEDAWPCARAEDCPSGFGPIAGCVYHPDRCDAEPVCVRPCATPSRRA